MSLRIKRSFFIVSLGIFLTISAKGYANDCFQEKPLASGELPAAMSEQILDVGREWRLPISSARPDIMTEARVKVHVFRSNEKQIWRARVSFSFPDPKPFGIPFSFQKIRVSWESAAEGYALKPAYTEVDWSFDCSGPGQSLYPRQSWSVEFDLDGTESNWFLSKPSFMLWGSRN